MIKLVIFTCTADKVRMTVNRDGVLVVIRWNCDANRDWLIDHNDYAEAEWLGKDLENIIAGGPNVWGLAEVLGEKGGVVA